MLKRFVPIMVVMAVLVGIAVVPAASVSAQDGGDTVELTETFTFPSNVMFGYPDSWALDETTVSDFFVMLTSQDVLAAFLQVFDLPALYGDMPLELEFLQQTYGGNAADTWGFDFSVDDFEAVTVEIEIDGEVIEREISVLVFEGTQNDSPTVGFIVIVPYSDGGYGQITTYAVGEAPATYAADVLAIAASMDVVDSAEMSGGKKDRDEDESAESEPVDVAGITLTGTFEFTSGVTFGYSDAWVVDEATISDFMVMLTAPDVLATFVQVFDLPALYGDMALELDFLQQTYGGSAADTWGFDFKTSDFATVIVNERELSVLAFEGDQNDSPVVGYIILIPYSDGGFGQITTYSIGGTPEDYDLEVLALAASMDVPGE